MNDGSDFTAAQRAEVEARITAATERWHTWKGRLLHGSADEQARAVAATQPNCGEEFGVLVAELCSVAASSLHTKRAAMPAPLRAVPFVLTPCACGRPMCRPSGQMVTAMANGDAEMFQALMAPWFNGTYDTWQAADLLNELITNTLRIHGTVCEGCS